MQFGRRLPFFKLARKPRTIARKHMCSKVESNFDVICKNIFVREIVESSLDDWRSRVPFKVDCAFSTLDDNHLPVDALKSGAQFSPGSFYKTIESIDSVPVLLLAESTHSTQTLLENCPSTMELPIVCVADSQTQARGNCFSAHVHFLKTIFFI